MANSLTLPPDLAAKVQAQIDAGAADNPVDVVRAGLEALEAVLRGFQESAGLEKLGPVVHPTRVALTGVTNGPGLFELMVVLGRERVAARASRALTALDPQ